MPPGGDISELCFVVLMEATNDQDQDLQEIMNEVQAQTAAKQFLRQQMQILPISPNRTREAASKGKV
jgi:hypothetical protein